ncbi:alpha-amylase [Pedobacter aquatilis]|uniref:alpha-amylase n=1 Tax=Pedobacter aquatilis TaxID=351343 RepID=UPI00292E5555|nr:alpha-amylase [Pedobacter aquatilis]
MENKTMLQYFEWYYPKDGSLWRKVSQEAGRLKQMGIDAIWLPPAHKGMEGAASTGYDSYDLYDLGEFDQKGGIPTKYGTKQEFVQAVRDAREQGIQVYADIVLNHLGGADEKQAVTVRKVDPENRNQFISEPYEIQAYTVFTYPGRNGKYSSFKWDFQCFTGVDFDAGNQESGVYSIQNQYGEGWEEVLDSEHGNYDYLMLTDIDFRNPHVREELKRWGEWFFQTAETDGYRLDAIKHMPAGFYNEWLDHMRSKTGKELFTVGEYWSPYDLQSLLDYIQQTDGRMSLFDACLQANFSRASKEGEYFDLSTILDGSLVSVRPELAVTLVENHDTQPLQSLEQTVEPWFRAHAYAIILLREAGYPCVFYSDVYGSNYTDKGTDGEDHEVTLLALPQLIALLALRRDYAYGQQRDYFDHPSCIGWTREGEQGRESAGLAVIMSNGEEGRKRMEVGTAFAGKSFRDHLGHSPGEILIGADGWAEFYAQAGSVSVWAIA